MDRFFTLIYAILLVNLSFAQERPPIQEYNTDVYNAENQNWSISQGENQYIYVANNKGLLEYNGAKWKLYPTPNETILRSVCAINNRIYTGNYMDFGYWEKDEKGILNYTSLSDKLKIPLVEDEQIWKIIPIDNWILFQSLNRIYIYNTNDSSYKFIETDTSITGMYKFNNDIYFQQINKGLYILKNGTSALINDNDIVKNNIIVNLFRLNDSFLLLTQDKGFYQINNDKLLEYSKLNNEVILSSSIYSALELEDESFLLGTISNGIIQLDKYGKVIYQINISNGLSNNTVLSVFEDQEKNVWLALDNGINCINFKSPYKIFNDKKGMLGTVYASKIFNDYLYIGSNQGLFYKDINSASEFKFVNGTQGQVWCLVEYDNTLFCGNNFGTFIIKNGTATKVANIQGTWDLKPVLGKPNFLLQGNYNGLNILEKVNGAWSFRNKIQGFNISSRHFDFFTDNEVFVNHEYKGVFKVILDKELQKIKKVLKDTSVVKSKNSSLFKYGNKIMYSSNKGIFEYGNDSFKKNIFLSNIFETGNYISGKTSFDKKKNNLWVFTEKNINRISQGTISNQPNLLSVPIPYSLRNGFSGYENITHIKNQEYLLGTSSGYIVIDLDKLEESNKNFEIEITQIRGVNHKNNDIFKRINKDIKGEFVNEYNNFEFSYSVPDYDKYHEVRYQHKLEGIYNQWSDWTTNSTATFTNLPYGDYKFIVRGKVGELLTQSKSYDFRINRPWYLSNLMITLYIVSIILFSLLMHNIYKTYYKRQRIKLLEKSQKEMQLKELEIQQQLMYLKNENLEKDIDGKNRELAVSTMSLIKKNEFLNRVKNELNTIKKPSDVKSVIQLIDRNITNNDDWKLFEEAFNNADKDFLSKIKEKHNDLTPNDLRLCAYLRLNLSSKEIAPLLNISHKSVEVKRYRLRKKLNLPHKVSLVSYILEI